MAEPEVEVTEGRVVSWDRGFEPRATTFRRWWRVLQCRVGSSQRVRRQRGPRKSDCNSDFRLILQSLNQLSFLRSVGSLVLTSVALGIT